MYNGKERGVGMQLWDIYHGQIPAFLQEAAQTPGMLRLQDVGMNCGCEYTAFPLFAGIAPYSRWDHSMGVGLIVWHFTGSMEQAMAGLLHDIAIPVFAHVVDFLYGDHMKQESTEAGTSQMIRESRALQEVLRKYGLSSEDVEDYHRYPVADNDSPRLCADRLEYTLGNAVNYGIVSGAKAKEFYDNLVVGCNEAGVDELMFRDGDAALAFAETALQCSQIYVADEDRYAMQSLAELLGEAMEKGICKQTDLYGQETQVIDKLRHSCMAGSWKAFCGLHEILRSTEPGKTGKWRKIAAKKRCIDPYILGEGRVSHSFPLFGEKLQEFQNSSQNDWLLAR